jgi:hypothetical protein
MLRIMPGFSSLFLAIFPAASARAETYALKAAALRAAPSPTAKLVDGVDANQSAVVLESKDTWPRVRLGADVTGWLPSDVLSDTWIKVWKRERKLLLMKGDGVERTSQVALGAQNPTGQKVKLGDGATPEGRF